MSVFNQSGQIVGGTQVNVGGQANELDNPVVVVDTSDEDKFEEQCKEYIDKGYMISSTSCGFAQSEKYDFCGFFTAILVLPRHTLQLNR